MKALSPEEKELIGSWILKGDRVIGDDICKRIEWLISEELVLVETGNWTGIYLDQNDGRYWRLTYPQSEMHGGGPPSLTLEEYTESENVITT